MNTQDIISSGLLELYALGQCNAAEAEQVEQWLQYPEVRKEYDAIQQAMESYAMVHSVTPDARVKQKLFDEIKTASSVSINENKEPAKIISIGRGWKMAATASVALLIGSMAFNFIFYNKYKDVGNQLASVKKEMTDMANANKGMKEDMTVMNSGTPVSLAGMPQMPDAKAKIYWVKNNGDVYIDASSLPPAPAGKQYQFWGIVDSKPVDGGMILTTNGGKQIRLQKMKSFGKAEAFAVSLEKAGGSPTPTTVVSMGKI